MNEPFLATTSIRHQFSGLCDRITTWCSCNSVHLIKQTDSLNFSYTLRHWNGSGYNFQVGILETRFENRLVSIVQAQAKSVYVIIPPYKSLRIPLFTSTIRQYLLIWYLLLVLHQPQSCVACLHHWPSYLNLVRKQWDIQVPELWGNNQSRMRVKVKHHTISKIKLNPHPSRCFDLLYIFNWLKLHSRIWRLKSNHP